MPLRQVRTFDVERALLVFVGQKVVGAPGEEEKHHPVGVVREAVAWPRGTFSAIVPRRVTRGGELRRPFPLRFLEQSDLGNPEPGGRQRNRNLEVRNADQGLRLIDRQRSGTNFDDLVGRSPVGSQCPAKLQDALAKGADGLLGVGAFEGAGVDEHFRARLDLQVYLLRGLVGGGGDEEWFCRRALRIGLPRRGAACPRHQQNQAETSNEAHGHHDWDTTNDRKMEGKELHLGYLVPPGGSRIEP